MNCECPLRFIAINIRVILDLLKTQGEIQGLMTHGNMKEHKKHI